MKPRNLFFLAAALLFNSLVYAQHEGPESSHELKKEKNGVGIFVGNTIIVQSGFNLPTVGLEYVRGITDHFGVGVISEVEIGSHIIEKNEAGDVISRVDREGAVLVLPTVFFKIYKGLIFYAGYGIEFEKRENLGLMKVGLDYRFLLRNPRWEVLPSVSWDHTRLFDGLVYGFIFSYKF